MINLPLQRVMIFIIFFAALLECNAQETTLELPTNDNTSSFNVEKNNGTSVFKVDGSGKMTGDGSGLSNVKSTIAYAQGNMHVNFREGHVPGLNLYEAQILREVTISCPGPGIILAEATGYADWESKNEDLLRIWFHPHPTVSPTNSWETPDFHNLRILSDYQCADSSDQYTSWSISKLYTVSSAQNYTVKVCADKPFTSSTCLIGDVVLSLIFFPTGGTGQPSPMIVSSPEPEMLLPDNIGVDGSPPGFINPGELYPVKLKPDGTEEQNNISTRMDNIESENDALKKRISELEAIINEIKAKN